MDKRFLIWSEKKRCCDFRVRFFYPLRIVFCKEAEALPEISTKEIEKQEVEQKIESFKEKLQGLPQYYPKYRSYTEILPSPESQRQFGDYKKQMEKLKERFCDISDEEECNRKLQQITYFRLKGYFAPLQKHFADELGTPPEKTRVPFETVILFYERDEQMRFLSLQILQKLEVFLRSQLSYIHAEKYGPYGYLDTFSYYRPRHDHHRFLSNLVKLLQDNKERTFVRHYLQRYEGLMPLWVISELMTFGDLTYFYEDWRLDDQRLFLKSLYGTSKETLQRGTYTPKNSAGWMKSCRYLRNVCAHCGQLYNRDLAWPPTLPREFDGQFLRGKRCFTTQKLWVALLAMRFLYPDAFCSDMEKWNNLVTPRMKELLDTGSETENKLLRIGWGFPDNWEDCLKIWEEIQ